jgi:hypothetical protein
MWHTINGQQFKVIQPGSSIAVGVKLRERTSAVLVQSDEAHARHRLQTEEASHRLQLCNALLLIVSGKLKRVTTQASHRGSDRVAGGGATSGSEGGPQLQGSKDSWDYQTSQVFEEKIKESQAMAARQYSPFSTNWMPHDVLRRLHGDWKGFYNKWRTRYGSRWGHEGTRPGEPRYADTASSLLASFFCGILVDSTQTPEDAANISRVIMEECLEVTNDGEEDASDAVPYYTMVRLVQTLSGILFSGRHPYVAMHLLCAILSDRMHRVH